MDILEIVCEFIRKEVGPYAPLIMNKLTHDFKDQKVPVQPLSEEEVAANQAEELEKLKNEADKKKEKEQERLLRRLKDHEKSKKHKKSKRTSKSYDRKRQRNSNSASSAGTFAQVESEETSQAGEDDPILDEEPAASNVDSASSGCCRKNFGHADFKKMDDLLGSKQNSRQTDPFDNNNNNGGGGGGKSQRKIRKAKTHMLSAYRLLREKYELKLVCKSCLVRRLQQRAGGNSSSSPCRYELLRDPGHLCSRDHLAVRDKKSNKSDWSLVRNLKSKSKFLCHQFATGQLCKSGYECPNPNTVGELEVWFCYLKNGKVSEFVDDLLNSDLTMRTELMKLQWSSPGFFRLACSTCYEEEEGGPRLTKKKKHQPLLCDSGHRWKGKMFYGDREIHGEGSECDHDCCLVYRKFLERGFCEEDLASLSMSVEQSKNSAKKREDGPKASEEFPVPPVSLNEACRAGMRAAADVDLFPFENLNEDFEREMSEEYERCVAASEAPYYRMLPGQELLHLLESRGAAFKRCRFNLEETGRAVCSFLDADSGDDSSSSVELRSRKNCGPCFSGDEVVVELKHTKELGDDGATVKRGTVVGLLRQAFDRREYLFLCTMDPHVNHLMIPINGVGPKIHAMREKSNYDHANMVFIYARGTGGELQLTGSCHVSQEDKETTLFFVRYLYWSFDKMYPFGYVSAIVKAGTTIEESQTILDAIYHVPKTPRWEGEDSEDSDPEEAAPSKREDLTGLFTISIDPEGSRDIDDAISVAKFPAGKGKMTTTMVIIHISDVSSHVFPGDRNDVEASKRMTSNYPERGPAKTMLTSRMTEKCSLLEGGAKRRALSVFFQCDEFGKIDASAAPLIKETLIENKLQLSYRKAQKILDGTDGANDELKSTLTFLLVASRELRRERLKMGWMFREVEKPFEAYRCSDAHQIVEEFMILTNKSVAEFVVDKFPTIAPLRSQFPPDEEKRNSWTKDWSFLTGSSAYLSRFFESKDFGGGGEGLVALLRDTTKELERCMSRGAGGIEEALGLVGEESRHPLHAVALVDWYCIQEKAFYVCSGDEDRREKSHYSLEATVYVQFTSPIRRYLDIVVHRIVRAALGGEGAPYTTPHVAKLCNKANVIWNMNRKYNREVNLLRIMRFLNQPLYVPVFVSHIEEGLMEFVSPFLPRIGSRCRKIKHNQLCLSDKPNIGRSFSGQEELRLTWDTRIFDADRDVFQRLHVREDANDEATIDPKRHVVEVQTQYWGSFLRALHAGAREDVERAWEVVRRNKDLRSIYQMGAQEVTSEMKLDAVMVRPQRKFSIDLKKGSVLAAQVGVSCYGGHLRPQVKMISLTDQLDICLCHKRNPVECFVSVPLKTFTAERYANIEEYVGTWSSLLSMEVADAAVSSGDSLFCHNVMVVLQKGNEEYFGKLLLEKSFCRKRKMAVGIKNDNFQDFLCLRFPIKCKNNTDFIPNKWLCHATCVPEGNVNKPHDEENDLLEPIEINFKVQHHDCSPPDEILSSSSLKCTVEFIARPLPERKMIDSLSLLEKGSELCKGIALGHSIDHLESMQDKPDLEDVDAFDVQIRGLTFDKNNQTQIKAIRKALTQPFTLIQGPPGTGKTVTGIKVAYFYARQNRDSGRKVMYCGPSNSSVDVAADWLKKLGAQCPRIVRVYGNSTERSWYPVPRHFVDPSLKRKWKQSPPGEGTIMLHHLIRQPGKLHAEGIARFERKFKKHLDDPQNVSDNEIEKYEKLLDEASKEEIQNYDIILCTCTVSSSSRLKDSHFAQLIVDECGMCKEPESLIPLVHHKKIKQVVLIGDHKQLQPIVKNKMASELGLQRSLFERYKDEAIMLTCQYRMHQSICAFPSRHFYSGKLSTFRRRFERRLERFWPNPIHPHVFCHVEGAEKSAVVSTNEGNEASKSNELEAKEALKIYRELLFANRRNGQPSICFLSQYEAQCSLIRRELVLTGSTGDSVSTVVSSQGNEYDYVILSLVRSMPEYEIEKNPSIGWCRKNLGFITDEHQINVALTRAKHGLVIIGNKHLLGCNNLFRDLLQDYNSKGCLLNSEDFVASFNRTYQDHRDKKDGESEAINHNHNRYNHNHNNPATRRRNPADQDPPRRIPNLMPRRFR